MYKQFEPVYEFVCHIHHSAYLRNPHPDGMNLSVQDPMILYRKGLSTEPCGRPLQPSNVIRCQIFQIGTIPSPRFDFLRFARILINSSDFFPQFYTHCSCGSFHQTKNVKMLSICRHSSGRIRHLTKPPEEGKGSSISSLRSGFSSLSRTEIIEK
jgi:hypothetical protein